MSTNQRGIIVLIAALVFGAIFCVWIPFMLLPQNGQAVAMPVITVPGEPLTVFGFETTNTVLALIVTDIIVILLAVVAYFRTKGWRNEVPGRFQAAMELIADGWWSITKQMAGRTPKIRNILYPLTASILLFLLAANLGKMLPGVESVGFIHCVHEGFSGFPRQEAGIQNAAGGYTLNNPQVFNSGTPVTHDAYAQCKSFTGDEHYAEYRVAELDPFFDKEVSYVTEEGDTINSLLLKAQAQADEAIAEEALPEYKGHEYDGWRATELTAESVLALNPGIKFAKSSSAHESSDDSSHAETDTSNGAATEATAEADAATVEGQESESSDQAQSEETASTELMSESADVLAATALEAGQTVVLRPTLIGVDATTVDNQLYHVTPFLRGAATDLNLTVGLALIAFFVIQAFGVSELGLNYFQKFINVHALGNLSNKPLGVIDFIAGLFEIVSELGKVISLAFRLFGAIFAGSILYLVIQFLLGSVTPGVILILELVVGVAQAAVFAVLTLIFSAQAMVSHIGDDHDHH